MKKLAAWALFVIYLNAAAQSLLPWVYDGVAHVFFWQAHLEQVHHGEIHSHHVGLEMAAAKHDTGSAHTSLSFLFNKDALSAHLLLDLPLVRNSSSETTVELNVHWLFHYRNFVGDVFCPPPDARRVSRLA